MVQDKKIYSWQGRLGYIFKADAQDVGVELEILEEKSNMKLTPQQVVDYAKDESLALHDCFEWDDKIAGPKYRVEQAHSILRSLKVEVIVAGTQPGEYVSIEVRRYEHVGGEEGQGPGVYMNTVDALADDEMRAEVISKVVRLLTQAQKKMEDYQKIIETFDEKHRLVLAGLIEEIKAKPQVPVAVES